jgi:hypothetical protein
MSLDLDGTWKFASDDGNFENYMKQVGVGKKNIFSFKIMSPLRGYTL